MSRELSAGCCEGLYKAQKRGGGAMEKRPLNAWVGVDVGKEFH